MLWLRHCFRVKLHPREIIRDAASEEGVSSPDSVQVRNETGRTSSVSKKEVFLTQHHQSHFPHVDTRRLLDLALVGGGVRAPQIRHGDGGVALRGVSREGEPGRDPGVSVPMHLTPSVGQDLEGKDRLKQVFPPLVQKGPALSSP